MFQLTPEVKAALTFFITQGIKSFLGLFGIEVAGFVSVIVAAVVAAVLFFAETLVAALPAEAQNVITAILGLLAAFGLHKTYATLAARR